MHELGLVNYVVKEVDKVAAENGIDKIKSVTLEFGEVSGIVTSYLYDYWDWYTKKFPIFEGSKLYCEEIRAITWCDDCKTTYDTITHGKTCPRCGSGNTWLIQGNEMRIKSIEVYDTGTEDDGEAVVMESGGEYRP